MQKHFVVCLKTSHSITAQYHRAKSRVLLSFFDSSKAEVVEVTVSASLKLVEVFVEKLSFREDIDVICLAVKLLFSSTQQGQNGPLDGENGDQATKVDVGRLTKDCVRKLSEKLVRKLKRILDHDMPDNYQNDALKRELQVRLIIMQWYFKPNKWSACLFKTRLSLFWIFFKDI